MTIIGGKGLSFLYPNQAHFYVETVTAEQSGYPDADMRQWPVYVFGLKDGTESSNAFIRDLLKTKRFGVDKQINPDVVRVFSTSTGKGFWAFGEEKSLIVLTEEDNRSSITLINVTGLPEQTIEDMIIKGVI
ncbi:hypothetical protein CF392_14445 [Tamilnaduibacter salinus]|nr:hypothetical protein CF392_14445 [Tamilnaduibacter salinus]